MKKKKNTGYSNARKRKKKFEKKESNSVIIQNRKNTKSVFQKRETSKKKSNFVSAKSAEAVILSLSRNFAFARPVNGDEDIFIYIEDLGGAFLGDKVLIHHIRMQERGPSGKVEKILEESTRTLVGVVEDDFGDWYFRADTGLRYSVPIERKGRGTAKPGEKVRASFRYSRSRELWARVIAVYGPGDSARVCAEAIMDQNQIPTEFSQEVLQEAERAASAIITKEVLNNRLDLRDKAICTIDSADAKDLDDAISVSRIKNGYRLGVHIADVSHYVRPGTALDEEAMNRGTSVYFADTVIPMLPEAISNGVCSLNANEDKLAMTALIDLDYSGKILKYSFKKSVIRSKVRGIYSEVNEIFAGKASEEIKKKYAPVIRSLNVARELAGILRESSQKRGSMDLESSESRFLIDKNGVCIGLEPRTSGESEQMIEQLMITANRAAAMLAKEKGLPFIYRVHEQPKKDRVDTFYELVHTLGFDARSLQHKGALQPRDFSCIMEQAIGTDAQRVISHQMLRTMAKARYDTIPIGHFGLALEDYCHFTSPIRRYPDTSIHRIISTWLETKNVDECKKCYGGFVDKAAKRSTDCEIRAMSAERAAEACYSAEYMKSHLGEVYEGIISGVTMRGVFVQLENTAEGFVPLESIPHSRFHYDGLVTQWDEVTGRKLTVGQKIKVRMAAADVASGRIDFAYEGTWPIK